MKPESTRLRLFPLNTVLFPGAVLDLHIFEPRYRQMIAECTESGENFGVVLIREGSESEDPMVMPHDVGTTAEIRHLTPLEGGRYAISTLGVRRFHIERIVSRVPYLSAEVIFLDDEEELDRDELRTLVDEIRDVFRSYLRLLAEFSGVRAEIDLPANPTEVSFVVGDALQVAEAMKQRLLELDDTAQRLSIELGFLRRLLPQLRALMERKRPPKRAVHGTFRSDQEKYFGKFFSLN